MFKIEGLDKLQRQLEDAQDAFSKLDGDLGSVSFDPHDPASVERAVQEISRIVDDRVGRYASNPIVGPMVDEMKVKYREAIVQKAATERLKSETGLGNDD